MLRIQKISVNFATLIFGLLLSTAVFACGNSHTCDCKCKNQTTTHSHASCKGKCDKSCKKCSSKHCQKHCVSKSH